MDGSKVLVKMKTTPVHFQALLCCAAIALATKQVPNFSWETKPSQLTQHSRLKIAFADGDHDIIDFYESKVLNNLQENPTCILSGRFVKEPNVLVTLSGLCTNHNDFQVTIVGSQRLRHTMLTVTNGRSEYIESLIDKEFGRLENTLHRSNITERSEDRSWWKKKFPPQGVKIDVHFRWTKEFKDYWDYYETDVSVAMGVILSHAQTYFKDPSSTNFFLRLEPVSSEEFIFPDKRTLSLSDSMYLQNHKTRGEVYIYFGLSKSASLYVESFGKTYPDQICKYGKKSLIVLLHKYYEKGTGWTLASMVAELVGIKTLTKYSWTGNEVKSRYEDGELQCLKKNHCYDNNRCNTTKTDQCNEDHIKYKCPKLCGVCSQPPYPPKGLELKLSLHYVYEVEYFFKNEYYYDFKEKISVEIGSALKQAVAEAQSYFDATNVTLRLVINKISEYKNPTNNSDTFSHQYMQRLWRFVRAKDGSDVDIFFAMLPKRHVGWSWRAYSNDVCKRRIESMAIVHQGRTNNKSIGVFGLALTNALAQLFGIPYWHIHHPGNFTEDLKSSWERGTLLCLHKLGDL